MFHKSSDDSWQGKESSMQPKNPKNWNVVRVFNIYNKCYILIKEILFCLSWLQKIRSGLSHTDFPCRSMWSIRFPKVENIIQSHKWNLKIQKLPAHLHLKPTSLGGSKILDNMIQLREIGKFGAKW